MSRHCAAAVGILRVEGSWALDTDLDVAVDEDELDRSRAAMSAAEHRRCGSRRRQQCAIPMNGTGTVSGTGSAIPSRTGRRWVRASINVIPSDQESEADEIFPISTSRA